MVWYASTFFLQAEDGIRDGRVTGVQTCALPILRAVGRRERRHDELGMAVEQLQEALAHGAGRTENPYPDFRHGSSLTLSDTRGMYQHTTEVVVVIARGVASRGLFCFPNRDRRCEPA